MLDNDTKILSCLDEIQKFLNPHKRNFYKEDDDAIFVHEAIFQKVSQHLGAHKIRIEESWGFNLCLGVHQYPMILVWIRNESQSQMEFLFNLYARSIYSFPWELTESIYQTDDRFHLVEDFVRTSNLYKYIRKIRIDGTYVFSSKRIKIIEFDETLPVDVLKPFRQLLTQNHIIPKNVYFLTRAFNYLKPTYLSYLKKPFHNPDAITQVLLLLDYHRANMKKGCEIFDVFDLIAMKLAIDDARLEYENCEFHKQIGKTLSSLKTNTLNLVEYCSGHVPWPRSNHIHQYLIYNFHNYFDRIVTYSDTKIFKIKLSKININDLLSYLANSNVRLTLDIDEADLNETSADALLEIMTSSRIQKNSLIKIVWNTDYKWYYSGIHETPTRRYQLANITFSFYGTNKYNFIENFLNWLKAVLGKQCLRLNFEFYRTEIVYAFIITNLNANELIFRSTTLTCQLINALKLCRTNRIFISECRIQNDHNVVESLEHLDHVWRVYIEHEEHTFSIINKFVELQLQSRSEFQFGKDIRIPCYDYFDNGMPNRLCLKDFKFYVNRDRTKIEVYHVIEKKQVNLYDYLYLDKFNNVNREFEHRDDFMFYQ